MFLSDIIGLLLPLMKTNHYDKGGVTTVCHVQKGYGYEWKGICFCNGAISFRTMSRGLVALAPMSRNAGRSAARPSRMHDHSISVMDIISPKSAAVILVNSMVELAGLSELDDGEVDVLVELASVELLEDDGPVA